MTRQFGLLKERRFAPLFHTQFLGAFNDNLFKAALSLIFVYSGLISAEATDVFVNAAAGLFILPFFLFSATAGQLADKYEKSWMVRRIKVAEIVIAAFGGLAVYSQNVYAMLVVLFLLGVQSTFFGPLKYAILPQQLDESELVGGNAQIEMGTFVSILLGTVAGGIVAIQANVNFWLTAGVVVVAVLGYLASRAIPVCPAAVPDLNVEWNIFRSTAAIMRNARNDRPIYLSILGISWFWLIGSVILAQIPNLTKVHLLGDQTVVTFILCIFTVSVAIGSLACERLSSGGEDGKPHVEIGIVPLGAAGITLAGIDLYFAIAGAGAPMLRDWFGFLAAPGAWRVVLDVFVIGVSGGLYIVPLYAFIQARSPETHRARMIAVINILNAVFMVAGAVLAIVWLGVAGLSIPSLLLLVMTANILVTVYLIRQFPAFGAHFVSLIKAIPGKR